MHLVAFNDQIRDRSSGIGTIDSDAKAVSSPSWSIAAVKSLLNVMDIISQQFYVGTGPDNADTQRYEVMLGSVKVADFKAHDPHVALVLNREYGASARGSEMCGVEDRGFARIASESDESIARAAGGLDVHQFFVDSTPNVDRTARPRGVSGMLNGAPRRRESAGIRIIPSRRDVERGACLAKRTGDRSQQYKKRGKSHARSSWNSRTKSVPI